MSGPHGKGIEIFRAKKNKSKEFDCPLAKLRALLAKASKHSQRCPLNRRRAELDY